MNDRSGAGGCSAPGTPAVLYVLPGVEAIPEGEFSLLLADASEKCRNRAQRFIRREDRCRCVAGEALSRFAVYRYSGFRSRRWFCETNEYGKPFYPECGVHFNLSHAGNWAVCGADRREIGVDIEKIHQVDPGIAGRFFTAAENDFIESAENAFEKKNPFYRLWTLKESYVKCIGKGFSCSFDSFSCIPDLRGSGVRLLRHDKALPLKYFREYHVDDAYACSVCFSQGSIEPVIQPVSIGEIIGFLISCPAG